MFRNCEPFVDQAGPALKRKVELFTENARNRPQDKIGKSDRVQDRGSFLKILKLVTAIE